MVLRAAFKRDNGCVSYRYYGTLQASRMAFYAIHCIKPTLIETLPLHFRHAGRKTALTAPQFRNLIQVAEPAKPQTGHVSRTQCRCLKYCRTIDLNAQHIGEKLHQPSIGHHTAIYAQLTGCTLHVVTHAALQVAGLVTDRLQPCGDYLGNPGIPRQAKNRPSCFRVPVRSTKP